MDLKALNDKFSKLKEYSTKKDTSKLSKLIYSLKLTKSYLQDLSNDEIIFAHVKLHNALSYKKPFAKFEDLKKQHDLIVKFMKNHNYVDKLDL